MASGLAVDADADFDLVLTQVEGRLAGVRDGARGERDAHRTHLRVDLLGHGQDGVQVVATLGGSAGDLLEQDGAGDAAASGGPGGILDGHIVIDHNGLDGDALHVGHLGSRLEVEDVAGVVLHNVQDARAAVDGLGGLEDRVRGRGGEDGAGNGGVQHSLAHIPGVQRLVAGATTRHQADLALDRGIGTNDVVRIEMHGDQIGMCCLETGQGFGDHIRGVVDQFLHRCSPLRRCGWTGSTLPGSPGAGKECRPHFRSPAVDLAERLFAKAQHSCEWPCQAGARGAGPAASGCPRR